MSDSDRLSPGPEMRLLTCPEHITGFGNHENGPVHLVLLPAPQVTACLLLRDGWWALSWSRANQGGLNT